MRLFYLPKVDLLVEIALERPVSHFPLQSTETVWPSLSPFPERMERKLEDEEVAFFSPQPPSRSSKGLHDNIFLPHASSGPLREIGALFVLSFFLQLHIFGKKNCVTYAIGIGGKGISAICVQRGERRKGKREGDGFSSDCFIGKKGKPSQQYSSDIVRVLPKKQYKNDKI